MSRRRAVGPATAASGSVAAIGRDRLRKVVGLTANARYGRELYAGTGRAKKGASEGKALIRAILYIPQTKLHKPTQARISHEHAFVRLGSPVDRQPDRESDHH